MTFLSDMNLVRIFSMRRYLVKSKSAIILSKDLCSMLREHPEGCYSITFNIQIKQKILFFNKTHSVLNFPSVILLFYFNIYQYVICVRVLIRFTEQRIIGNTCKIQDQNRYKHTENNKCLIIMNREKWMNTKRIK